ncbi:hypothetical protein B0T19DRAFT_9064 [Cercophora scortea]|uniref:Uncharacterized protein n=1 Tax=Cercophora scortea TaxID=314031 RepID=A0AAE0J216_9PEZI|nr:hypothetical protein B0T19DRAFT_9064 [Cercophora scortea]
MYTLRTDDPFHSLPDAHLEDCMATAIRLRRQSETRQTKYDLMCLGRLIRTRRLTWGWSLRCESAVALSVHSPNGNSTQSFQHIRRPGLITQAGKGGRSAYCCSLERIHPRQAKPAPFVHAIIQKELKVFELLPSYLGCVRAVGKAVEWFRLGSEATLALLAAERDRQARRGRQRNLPNPDLPCRLQDKARGPQQDTHHLNPAVGWISKQVQFMSVFWCDYDHGVSRGGGSLRLSQFSVR